MAREKDKASKKKKKRRRKEVEVITLNEDSDDEPVIVLEDDDDGNMRPTSSKQLTKTQRRTVEERVSEANAYQPDPQAELRRLAKQQLLAGVQHGVESAKKFGATAWVRKLPTAQPRANKTFLANMIRQSMHSHIRQQRRPRHYSPEVQEIRRRTRRHCSRERSPRHKRHTR